MGATPQWKVYDGTRNYRAACKEPEAALVLAEWYGEGATVRLGHGVALFTIGVDTPAPSESIDGALDTIERHRDERSCGGCGSFRPMNDEGLCTTCVRQKGAGRLARKAPTPARPATFDTSNMPVQSLPPNREVD